MGDGGLLAEALRLRQQLLDRGLDATRFPKDSLRDKRDYELQDAIDLFRELLRDAEAFRLWVIHADKGWEIISDGVCQTCGAKLEWAERIRFSEELNRWRRQSEQNAETLAMHTLSNYPPEVLPCIPVVNDCDRCALRREREERAGQRARLSENIRNDAFALSVLAIWGIGFFLLLALLGAVGQCLKAK